MTSSNKPSVISIRTAIKEIMQEIDDREWKGDFTRSAQLNRELYHLKDLELKGELWYPLF